MPPTLRRSHAILLTLLATLAVALVRLAAAPWLGSEIPLLPFTFSVVFAAWLGGVRLGLLATALGWLLGHYLFFPPPFAFGPLDAVSGTRSAIYFLGNGLASWLVSALQEARRRAATEHERLVKSEAFHAAIADITTDFAFEARVEPDGRIVPESVSEGFAKLFGRSVGEVATARDMATIFHPDDAPRLGEHVAGLLAGKTMAGEVRTIGRDGRTVWLAYRNRPLRDASGRVTRIYGAARDVTREKEAEAARAAAAAEAETRAGALRENSERLQEALTIGRMVAWDYDLATGVVIRSPNARALIGLASGSIDDFLAILHPEDRADVEACLERAAKGDGEYECEYRVRGPDGATLWFSDRGRLRRDAAGRPAHLTGIRVDVTAHKRAEQALREREEQLRLALDAAAMIGFVWDVESGVVTRLGEVPADARLGRESRLEELAALIHPDDRPDWEERIRAALAGETPLFRSEYRVRTRDGGWSWLLVHGRVERAPDGTPRTLTGLGIDVTPLKEMQEALREADRRKDEFLATLAHELRNPLAPLRSGLQVLQLDESIPPATRRVHDMMERQIDQMVRLVDDLLEVSRITRGQIELRRRTVSLQTVVDHAVETSRPAIEAGRHQFAVELPETPLWLDADPVRLAQVFSNLLNNAARYTPAGGRIALVAQREDGGVAVSVRDTGIGLADEDRARVFEMFVQGDRTQAGGLGIGLALVRALVAMHGGRVEAHSEGLGHGSEFVVHLPLAAPEDAAAATPDAAATADDTAELRILAVDDNRDAADSLASLLRCLGAEVTVAYDGERALEAIRAEHPRLAFVDLGMPVIDGFELARRVRSDPALDDVMLVALSGWGQDQDRQRSRAAGFDRHLVKPVELAVLKELVGSLR